MPFHYTLALVEFGGGHDYLHVLVNYPSMISVFSLVNSIKSVLSRPIRQERHHTFAVNFGAERCGPRITLRAAAVALRSPSFANTSSNSKQRTKGRLRRPRYPSSP
jgi:REP element-mobilizing transposase RayT